MADSLRKVLIVDDQSHVLEALQLLFEMRGDLTVARASGPSGALNAVRNGDIGVVVQDMNYTEGTTSGEEGESLFRAIREIDPAMPVVLMTAWGALRAAVDLVKQGADEYLQKPWDDAVLLKKVQQLLRARQIQPKLDSGTDLCGLQFQSAAMHSAVSLAVKVAASNVSVMVTGPNGAGKEKFAEIVQANSLRKTEPFIKVNVGALPDELFAAEIFGAEAGAFTGARTRRVGRFEAADGGTLFLDEMGNLSLESQGKLLRALQSGEFERLGSSQTRRADVRIIAATNIHLADAIASGAFREDLFYRLAVIEVEVPPLAERIEDIVPLAQVFIEQFWLEDGAAKSSSNPPVLSSQSEEALAAHAWPGNVRELQNRMRRALLMAEGAAIEPQHFGLEAGMASSPPSTVIKPLSENSKAESLESQVPSSLSALEQAERQTIEKALGDAQYVVSKAASLLGLSRQALYRRMQRVGLKVKRDVR